LVPTIQRIGSDQHIDPGKFLCLQANSMLMSSVPIQIDQIYVPAHLRRTHDPAKVQQLAEKILSEGLKTPIQVRRDANRYVLVTGLHRLEAMRALGETSIESLIVRARLR
jgi:sulfiredoxin